MIEASTPLIIPRTPDAVTIGRPHWPAHKQRPVSRTHVAAVCSGTVEWRCEPTEKDSNNRNKQTDNDMLLRVEKVKLENRDCSTLVHTLRGSLSATQSC